VPKKNFIPQKERTWIETRERFHLSHAQIQMARELGMDPGGFGKLANHRQEPWKAPLPTFIENLYFKRFKKRQPDTVKTIEQIVKERRLKKEAKKIQKENVKAVEQVATETTDSESGNGLDVVPFD
jgi:hypothetical protein